MSGTIRALELRIRKRAKSSPDISYTRKLLNTGTQGCAKKFGEEAVELIIASSCEDDRRVISESADVIYHLLVLLKSREVSFSAIKKELKRRESQSGLAEKAGRERK
ncbi:MAG: phosphoribosyl-ATP diphosphatase [Candidatus Pacebacteria bacterium]|nr:phosphoribosyl-ATP diphosphatase [Candidatus Paceibacterota bacterium]